MGKCSDFPKFQYSIFPFFEYFNIPTFQYSNLPFFHSYCTSGTVAARSYLIRVRYSFSICR